MNKYKLEVDERQARVILAALDLYSRLGMCQWETLVDFARDQLWKPLEQELHEYGAPKETLFDIVLERLNLLRNFVTSIKTEVLFQSPNSSWGIHNDKVPRDCRAAYDIQQVLRKTVAEAGATDREAAGEKVDRGTVPFHSYFATCEEQPAAKCERVQ